MISHDTVCAFPSLFRDERDLELHIYVKYIKIPLPLIIYPSSMSVTDPRYQTRTRKSSPANRPGRHARIEFPRIGQQNPRT